MLELHSKLVEDKGVKENTANKYIRDLYIVNRNQPFRNLAFLKKYGEVDVAISPYALNTQKNIIISVVSVLSLFKDKKSYKNAYNYWNGRLHILNEEAKEQNKKMNNKERENYMKWEDIIDIRDNLRQDVAHFQDNNSISQRQFAILKKYLVLSLYTYIPPRRNRDYQECYIVWGERNREDDRNYYDAKNHKFIFNQYKTSKRYGQQILNIGGERGLVNALDIWIKHHPLLKGKRLTRNTNTRLLVNYDGSPLDSVNAITRILYSALGKKIGSSMLRHIYLTDKYKNELSEMRADAEAMAHSTAQQKEYVYDDLNENI